MTIEQANSYFEALPDGFASTDQLRAALPASAQKVQFVGVAGTLPLLPVRYFARLSVQMLQTKKE